jgi:hypothetical protein
MLDVEMDQIIGTIVDSLFSVCVTLGMKWNIVLLRKIYDLIDIGSVPIIRCPKGEAAEIVGEVCYSSFKRKENILSNFFRDLIKNYVKISVILVIVSLHRILWLQEH